ncbi:YtcA family lipoprotein [Pseudochelatococcus contaminans]|uniref:Uncharacterized protein YtcA n=1 Tax=Pseudochelatococcus contaminans TaxID=1538103 RepID=A0A7W5Z1Y1_9HYPH|nr:YtcA family lipoprotein [Pseudochelatococcus contaminans]MBB3808344.1 putative membrane protein [Pseudochelatococcus contaminans]
MRIKPRVGLAGRISAFMVAALAPLAIGLGGCVATSSPSIEFFGAYFPSWLACTLAGIVGAVLVRIVFVAAGIDDAMPFRLLIYVCIAASLGFIASIIGFGR